MHFDFPERMCMYQSLSLSLSIYICKNGLDPDQTRMEFKTECFVNLKICACDRKYAKCRTKVDAHDKMGFQYISINVYIVRPMRGSRGWTGGPNLPPPLKIQRWASEMPFKVFRWRADDDPLLVIFGSSLSSKRRTVRIQI